MLLGLAVSSRAGCPAMDGNYGIAIVSDAGSKATYLSGNRNFPLILDASDCSGKAKFPDDPNFHSFKYDSLSCSIVWDSNPVTAWKKILCGTHLRIDPPEVN